MNNGYTTIFETSYFSNGWLLWDFGYLAAGIAFLILAVCTRRPGSRQQKAPIWVFCLWAPFWFLFTGLSLYSNLTQGHRFTSVLANNRCEVVEGTVQVLRDDRYDKEDHIRIGDKEFAYGYYHAVLNYNRTISHGGKLTNGAVARLHYMGQAILKVEIKK